MEIDDHIPQLHALFARRGVILAYLFGSQAGGAAGPLSDVDIAVLLGPEVPRERWGDVQIDLIGDLTSLFHRNDVDVVTLNRATPLLAWEVVRCGQRIYEPDPGVRVDFETAAFRRYVDTKPLRKLQLQRLAEWIEERRRVRQPSNFRW